MTTHCKFTCQSVNKRTSETPEFPYAYDVEFHPVLDGSAENKEFFAWTPAGILRMTLKVDLFVPGKDYYLDITEVPAPVAVEPVKEFAPEKASEPVKDAPEFKTERLPEA